MKLDAESLRAYRSPYLDGGWKDEAFSLAEVDIMPGRITGRLDLVSAGPPADGEFHLSAQAALVWISQLGIIYACWENALPRKMGEVYMRDLSLCFHRPVTRTQGIEFEVSFPGRCRRVLSAETVFYRKVPIRVDRDAFVGTASFVLPLQRRTAADPPANPSKN